MLKLSKYHRHRKTVDHLFGLIVPRKKLCTQRKVKLSIRNIIKRDLTLHQAKENLFQFYDKNKSKFSQSKFLIGALSAAGIIYGLNVVEKWLFTTNNSVKKEDPAYDPLTKEEEEAIEKILSAIIESYTENAVVQEPDKPVVPETLSNNRFKPVKNISTTFCDIQGCDEAKQDLENLIHFLRNPEKFNELGATLPRGVILVGPPGVGKTSLARAVAGEAKVPFIYASASEFDEMYVGVGASRVRELFESAKAHSPCVIFIDELDAISNKKVDASLRQSQSQTLSQLLIELDGFQSTQGIIVLSATNNKEALDKALIRPGRFDLEVELVPPDFEGRKALFKLYVGKVKSTGEIDYEKLAKGSVGFTGAEIKNMVNQAALMAGMNNEKHVQSDHLWKARDRILMGVARKKVPDDETNRITAFHEAGHALTAFLTPDSEKIHKVTIIPRNHSLGFTSFLGDKERHHMTKSQLQARIDSLLAGKIAEELIYGPEKVTTGGSDDLKRATAIAQNMVMNLGMSQNMKFRTYSSPISGFQDSNLSPQARSMVDEEVDRILHESHERVRKLLVENTEKLKTLAENLLKHETLDNSEVSEIMSKDSSGDPPTNVIYSVLGEYKNWVIRMSNFNDKKD